MKARNGRKYNGMLFSFLAVLAIFGMCAFVPSLVGVAGVAVGGIMGAYAIYCGGNVSNKWVTVKASPAPPTPPAEGEELRGVY